MYPFAVFGLFLGIIGALTTMQMQPAPEQQKNIAINFGIYRDAALEYAQKHETEGIINNDLLVYPTGWKPLKDWRTYMTGKTIFVFGDATPEEILSIRQLYHGSLLVGVKRSESSLSTGLTGIPDTIPTGSIVSVRILK